MVRINSPVVASSSRPTVSMRSNVEWSNSSFKTSNTERFPRARSCLLRREQITPAGLLRTKVWWRPADGATSVPLNGLCVGVELKGNVLDNGTSDSDLTSPNGVLCLLFGRKSTVRERYLMQSNSSQASIRAHRRITLSFRSAGPGIGWKNRRITHPRGQPGDEYVCFPGWCCTSP